MEDNKPLEILDADNIDFNAELLDDDESNNELDALEEQSKQDTQEDQEDKQEDQEDQEDKQEDQEDQEDQDTQDAEQSEQDTDTIDTHTEQENNKTDYPVEPDEMALDEPGFFYNLLHILDDIYVYGRTVIENNYFNLSDNVDFNLVYPNIYIGNYSTSTNLELLQGLGITHIITVLPTFNPPFPDKFTYLHIQAYDDETQNLEPFFQKTNQFISDVLTQSGKLLIHCMVGRSRSVSVLMAFLINVILGNFNQSIVDTTTSNDVSNKIEYNKFIGKQSRVITDGIVPVRYINERTHDKHDTEEISKLEYLQPEFGNKFRKFINYKKDLMLREIEKLVEKYKDNKKDDLYSDILSYVKKYRAIACPNMYFEKQLRILLNGK